MKKLTREWVRKAEADYRLALKIARGNEPFPDQQCFHCQQAAEKALKAWLTSRDIVFPKTHSLEDIVRLCIPSASGFSQFQHHAEELTPLAMAYRYPGYVSVPGLQLASRALALAEEICDFCEQQLGLKKE